jgi:hypothetical protein
MSNWLALLAAGFAIGAVIACSPVFLRRMLIRLGRRRLAETGLRPDLRVRVMVTPEDDPDWAYLTIHVSNRSKDIWWLQQIDFAATVRGALASDRLFARIEGNLAAVPIDALPESGALFPRRSIRPDDSSSSHFTGVADGTCEHAYLYCPSERDRIAVGVTLRRMGGRGRAIAVKANRAVSWERSADHTAALPLR